MSEINSWLSVTRRLAAGDRDSLESYYRRYAEFMLDEARRATSADDATCWDIVHDAMLKVIRCIRPMKHEGQVTNWTRTVVRSIAYDHLRRRRRKIQRAEPLPKTAGDGDAHDIGEQLDLEAQVRWLEEHLQRLPDELQRLIHWRYRLGWTLQRIADTLGWKPGAVDGRLRRAIERLRATAQAKRDD